MVSELLEQTASICRQCRPVQQNLTHGIGAERLRPTAPVAVSLQCDDNVLLVDGHLRIEAALRARTVAGRKLEAPVRVFREQAGKICGAGELVGRRISQNALHGGHPRQLPRVHVAPAHGHEIILHGRADLPEELALAKVIAAVLVNHHEVLAVLCSNPLQAVYVLESRLTRVLPSVRHYCCVLPVCVHARTPKLDHGSDITLGLQACVRCRD
mmetsp:Transcript_36020/g.114502  ORF Transcript_36020/g.114502 Transcript_36020/m.114502 type:complete len:213 (+) Transcript_36020:311-949(+)